MIIPGLRRIFSSHQHSYSFHIHDYIPTRVSQRSMKAVSEFVAQTQLARVFGDIERVPRLSWPLLSGPLTPSSPLPLS